MGCHGLFGGEVGSRWGLFGNGIKRRGGGGCGEERRTRFSSVFEEGGDCTPTHLDEVKNEEG